jgi:hypothetical protein
MGRSRRDMTILKGLQTLVGGELAALWFTRISVVSAGTDSAMPPTTSRHLPSQLQALRELGARLAAKGVRFLGSRVMAVKLRRAPG